ncbi:MULTISPECIES: hypothetical protein [Listeria]|uniref:hypothetical protein n=1 Tax=Listeria TaxID=1637 RepID=UPI000B58BAAA|nr:MULTISPECIES: hypothetical protein [Listeria]
MDNQNKKPSKLIRQERIVPSNETAQENDKSLLEKKQVSVSASQSRQFNERKGLNRNQVANVKISRRTKEEIDLLIKLTSHKFAYEVIESMIDNYVDNILDPDQRRAFKTLSSVLES